MLVFILYLSTCSSQFVNGLYYFYGYVTLRDSYAFEWSRKNIIKSTH